MDNELLKGLIFKPRFIKQVTDYSYGDVITHEQYDQILNLNGSQGDYNSEVLRILFTESDPTKVYHIPYLDKNVSDLNAKIEPLENSINTLTRDVNSIDERLTTATQDIINIISGVQTVGHSVLADNLSGVYDAPTNSYYGKKNDEVGFYSLDKFVTSDNMEMIDPETVQIYITPEQDSIDETMLTNEVRAKLNRFSITSYTELTDKPCVNGIALEGNKTLSDLGIQPVGNYLTAIPDEYITESELATYDYLNKTTAADTYATKNSLNTTNNNVDVLQTAVNTTIPNTYARVGVGSAVSNPKKGDIYVTF